MAIVGPGAIQEVSNDVSSTLDGATEYEYVTVFNPLSDDFAVKVGQTKPVNMPFKIHTDGQTNVTSTTEQEVGRNYGLTLKNPDHQGVGHITNTTIVKAGQTMNFLGNEAQVAVRQIVNELMQREGNQKLLSDPTLRREAEERVIIRRGTVEELMSNPPANPQQQRVDALNKSNEAAKNEEEFPGLRGRDASQGDSSGSRSISDSAKLDTDGEDKVSKSKTAK